MASQIGCEVDGGHGRIVSLPAMLTIPRTTRRYLILAAATLLSSSRLAVGHSQRHGAIAIGHAWALPSAISDGQAFVPLVNTGVTPDALVAARSDMATAIELRANARYDDPAAASFVLEKAKPFPMRPQARHLRLVGLKTALVAGDTFNVVLDFEQAGEVEVLFYVENAPGD
jgi:periplasmic copper chaperone A